MNNINLPPRTVTLTPKAAQRLQQLRQDKSNPSLRLRLMVSGGGCAGFRYDFSLDDQKREGDHIFPAHGAELVIDEASLDLIAGSEIDFIENLMGSAFEVKNPNAASGCGCGASFSIKQD